MNNLKFRAYFEQYERMIDNIGIINQNMILVDFTNSEELEPIFITDKIHVMQSTGFKDKNGKEIFDGDIVSKENEYVVIKSFTGLWKAVSQKDDEKDRELYFLTLADVCEDIEVIGNIYENRELLG